MHDSLGPVCICSLIEINSTHSDDIQHETIGFARIRARAPAQHLLVQRRTLGGPRHNNAVHRGLVKAFRKDGTIGDHARLARVQPVEDGPAGGQRGGPIQGFRRNASGSSPAAMAPLLTRTH